MSTILKAENISKQYRLGTVGTGTLSHDLNRWWHQLRGKEDPYLKVGAVNDRSGKATDDYVWALREIDFEVKQGEVLGIIGKNGAGKSTLLKILSRVTAPTTGSIKTKGRIASLLEVGTGFHPELTGRENIFMNGAVLGMTKTEIKSKLDEIIAFSGCERYIDTPVKRYSSGMTVRLGFAVAAHLEPEILVVDEVLAVGDAEFQKKAIGKMKELSKGEGRTVLFVSHNMLSIQKLCDRCIILEHGKVLLESTVEKAIKVYLNDEKEKRNRNKLNFPFKIKNASIVDFHISNHQKEKTYKLISGNGYTLNIVLQKNTFEEIKFNVRLQIFNENQELITTINTFHTDSSFLSQQNKKFMMSCQIEKLPITYGNYILGVQILDLYRSEILYENKFFKKFKVYNGDFFKSGKLPDKNNLGKTLMNYSWKITS